MQSPATPGDPRAGQEGPRCLPPALEQVRTAAGQLRGRRAALPGGARGVPAGGGGGAAGARPGRSGKEELGCTMSLVPTGAALPPPSLLLFR